MESRRRRQQPPSARPYLLWVGLIGIVGLAALGAWMATPAALPDTYSEVDLSVSGLH